MPFLLEEEWLCVCFDMSSKKATMFHPHHPFWDPPRYPNRLLSLSKDLLQGLASSVGSQFERNIFQLDDWTQAIFGWDGNLTSKLVHS